MDLEFSDEHAELRAVVRQFARAEVAPVIGALYERGEFPYAIVRRMGAMGLFGHPPVVVRRRPGAGRPSAG
ncbi:acyl-CoA dehydrogenase family protein [Nakamurella leprariae]|uniref:acyl-CoA dehydrogenase family protein n=1 Tax=Nakamurella leprariae TaxID=2803911 RepID=UPI001F184064|nr:acyl-CoA dehydrogenase family protein [Nakamurella leprariae]